MVLLLHLALPPHSDHLFTLSLLELCNIAAPISLQQYHYTYMCKLYTYMDIYIYMNMHVYIKYADPNIYQPLMT